MKNCTEYITPQKNKFKRIDELDIGSVVVDNSWLWEHKSGCGYTGIGVKKPVNWIVAGKNHYEMPEHHVTLVSEELIANYPFDRGEGACGANVSNLWVTESRSSSLRQFLENVVYAEAFSAAFLSKILLTKRKYRNRNIEDHVFILSADELGANKRGVLKTPPIGRPLELFSSGKGNCTIQRRKAEFEKIIGTEYGQPQLSKHPWDVVEIEYSDKSGLTFEPYWTCSPVSFRNGYLYIVLPDGNVEHIPGNDATTAIYGLRLAINIRADTRVSFLPNHNNCYEIEGIVSPVEKLFFKPDYFETYSNDNIALALQIKPVYASNKSVKYKSTKEVIAAINCDGLLKAKKPGETLISAQALDGSRTSSACHIIVQEQANKVKLYDLKIGSRVVDRSWVWDFRKGANYSGNGEAKPVVWIIVAKDHYEVDKTNSSVTLMSEDLIANYCFDKAKFRGDFLTTWRNSGMPDGNIGLRPFLNGDYDFPAKLNFHFYVAGTMYNERSANIALLNKGSSIILKREPENCYDHNAIAVNNENGRSLGYIPAELAVLLAPLLDLGVKPFVRVARVDNNNSSSDCLRLELYLELNCDRNCINYFRDKTFSPGSFFDAFSDSFKEKILVTTVPNVDINSGVTTLTHDKVFIPSHTELEGEKGVLTNEKIGSFLGFNFSVGKAFPYFSSVQHDELLRRRLPSNNEGFFYYWTRSACRSDLSCYKGSSNYPSNNMFFVVNICSFAKSSITCIDPSMDFVGIRPLVNLNGDTLVHRKQGTHGHYYISYAL